tara:strand:+ start:331 stop:477 length:147 start_codon:yes stop_codon:yes gene_type:complete
MELLITGAVLFIAGYITGVMMMGDEVFKLTPKEFVKERKYWNEMEDEQ